MHHYWLLLLWLVHLLLLWLLLILAVAHMIREEDREVVPEVRLSLHLADDFADTLVEVLPKRPHAD